MPEQTHQEWRDKHQQLQHMYIWNGTPAKIELAMSNLNVTREYKRMQDINFSKVKLGGDKAC